MRLSGCKLVEVGTTNRNLRPGHRARPVARHGGWCSRCTRATSASSASITARRAPSSWPCAGSAACRCSRISARACSPRRPGLGRGGAAARGRAVVADGPRPPAWTSSASRADKLLGGPQAGVLAGRADLVARCRRHELFRALRPDRLALAALAGTLRAWREGGAELPVVRALAPKPGPNTCSAPATSPRGSRSASPRRAARPWPRAARRAAAACPRVRCARRRWSWSGPASRPPRWPRRCAAASRRSSRASGAAALRLDVLALLPGDEDALLAACAALPQGPA